MRARFTAHVAHNFKFLHDSYRGTAGKPYVPEAGEPTVVWTRLEVHSHEVAADNPDKAWVDFSAYGIEDKVEKVLHEKAEFQRVNGVWLYTREARLGPAPVLYAIEMKVLLSGSGWRSSGGGNGARGWFAGRSEPSGLRA